MFPSPSLSSFFLTSPGGLTGKDSSFFGFFDLRGRREGSRAKRGKKLGFFFFFIFFSLKKK